MRQQKPKRRLSCSRKKFCRIISWWSFSLQEKRGPEAPATDKTDEWTAEKLVQISTKVMKRFVSTYAFIRSEILPLINQFLKVFLICDLHYFVFLYLGWNPKLGAHPLCLESFKLAYLSTKLLLFCSYSQWMIKGQKAILAWKNFGLWHQFLFMTCLWNCILHFKDMKCFKTWGFMTFHKDYLVNSWLKAFKHYRIIPLACNDYARNFWARF